MKTPKVLYILIGIFCIFAIIAAIYAQFIEQTSINDILPSNGNSTDTIVEEKNMETIKSEMNALFTSTLNLNGADTTGITKLNPEKEIVYTAFDISKSEASYEVNIKIPIINIKSEDASAFNSITQVIFANKANEVMAKTDASSKTIYSIDYVGYVNDNILSLIIKSTLKEGESAQRVMIQTYNYNLKTNTKVTLNDLITSKMLNKEDVNKTIQSVIQNADNEAKAIQSMGYNDIYVRDLTSEIYTVDGSSVYFLGPNKSLYIVYPYGNQNFTSEMDVILFE